MEIKEFPTMPAIFGSMYIAAAIPKASSIISFTLQPKQFQGKPQI